MKHWLVHIRREGAYVKVHSDLCPLPLFSAQAWVAVSGLARHSAQPPVAANLICCPLLSHATGLDLFSRLIYPAGTLLTVCVRQGKAVLGTPKLVP